MTRTDSNGVYRKNDIVLPKVAEYLAREVHADTPLEAELRKKTLALPNGRMISGSDVGAFLTLSCQMLQAKMAIEVGTFTGYTALRIAKGLQSEGKLICCDIEKSWTDLAQEYWHKADIHQKIELRLAPALETLETLLSEYGPNSFDFAFIDADKGNYDHYFEFCLKLIRPRGLIVLDNMLWRGEVAEIETQDKITRTIKSLNDKIAKDPRVSSCLLTVGDGLHLAVKL
jgi:predicted O-methyltransferase YrrM